MFEYINIFKKFGENFKKRMYRIYICKIIIVKLYLQLYKRIKKIMIFYKLLVMVIFGEGNGYSKNVYRICID